MKKELQIVSVVFLCIFLFSICIPAVTAYNDCLVDRTRAVQDPTEPALADYINARMSEARNSINSIHWVNGVADHASSPSDRDFINHIDDLSSNANIVAVHSHGGISGSSSFLRFGDDSDLYDNDVNNWLDPGGYFLYAGSCHSAEYTDLGNSFVSRGFNTYFGFTGTVNTIYSSRFCSAFFYMAKYLDTTVSEARDYALLEVLDDFGKYGGTDHNRFIGDSNLFLAPSDW